jgi:hypothetical protein
MTMSGDLMLKGLLHDATVCERVEGNEMQIVDDRDLVDYSLLLRSSVPSNPPRTDYRCRIYMHLIANRFEPPLKYSTQII